MTATETNNSIGPDTRIEAVLNLNAGWLTALGVLTILTGMMALAFPLASTLAVEVLTGSVFLTVGVFTTVHAIMERKEASMWWELLTGLLYVVAGIAFLANPFGGIIALTLMLGATFIVEGTFRILMAVQMERSRKLFLLIASGALSILLGSLVLAGMVNGASLTVIGVLLGINFIVAGSAMIGTAYRSAGSDPVA